VERKYQLTRIKAGDYIIPSNDGKLLLRISSYREQGPLLEMRGPTHGLLHLDPPMRTEWQVHQFDRTVKQLHEMYGDDLPDDFLEWDHWDPVDSGYRSRQAAIEDAVGR
jgi:hypothetical protein